MLPEELLVAVNVPLVHLIFEFKQYLLAELIVADLHCANRVSVAQK